MRPLTELVPGLTSDELAELTATGQLALPYGDEPGSRASARLAPAFAEPILADLDALQPKIGVEVLFLVDAPAETAVNADLLTTLHEISTMEGIEYYSASRDRMRTLFHESYVVASPEDLRPVPDPTIRPGETPDVLYIFQRDSSFGRNVLELTYTVSPDAVRLRMRNLTRMNYQGIIPAVGPGDLGLNLVVYPLGDRLLFYGNAAARPLGLLGMETRVQRSFTNRLIALYRWFLTRA